MSQERLVVWLGDREIGSLSRDRGRRVRFEPVAAAVHLTASPEGRAVPWSPAFSTAWFEGLLPEDAQRSAAERLHGIERGDSFALLAAIGWECAGAVSVMPPGGTPARGDHVRLSLEDVLERLDALPRPVDDIDASVRLSLGGVQEKLLLAWLDDAWHLPIDGAPSTHLLKPEPAAYPGLAVAEAWCLRAASEVTRAAEATVLSEPGHRPTIVVRRYDRHVVDGVVHRSHQEDLCQVLGLPPDAKYARSTKPGEPSLGRLAGILMSRAADPPAELARLLVQVTVTVALGNADAHAKNQSLLLSPGGEVSLAPMYDIAPTIAFLPSQRTLSLPVAGKWRIREVTVDHLLAEARSWGLPERTARRVVDDTLAGLRRAVSTADEAVPGLPEATRSTVRVQLERLAAS